MATTSDVASATHSATGRRSDSPARRLSARLQRSPRTRLGLLLTGPLLWLGLAYIGALAALLVTAFWTTDTFTGQIQRVWTTDSIHTVLTDPVYRTVTIRTIGVAALVTVIDAIVALPIAFYMAKVASRRWQPLLVAAVLMPLWASYLVKAYAWRSMFGGGGLIDWVAGPFGAQSPGYGLPATICTLAYLWFPYMVLPIFAGLERLPDSLLEAAGDLGARPGRTVRTVVLPMAFPAVVAGSIFTFSLSLGDYVAVKIVGGTKQFLGNLVYDNIGAASNQPLAAAVALVPIVIMLVYLFLARRAGALDNL
jgi:putative spermidine/putrescine transport system permease protein